ncbi:MAG: hypothetical protein GY810_29440 [Aureispira sp.]|nr:hypothetical protein [Aureispira sp.]
MKYRRLTMDELESLEEDFVKFLASNQITADEWVKLKEQESERVHELIELFSDIVMQKVLTNIEYLQHRSKQVIRVFRFGKDKITMTGLQLSDTSKDLTNPVHLQLLSDPEQLSNGVKIFQMEKEYKMSREEEIFDMMESYGCQPAPKAMFDMLVNLRAK